MPRMPQIIESPEGGRRAAVLIAVQARNVDDVALQRSLDELRHLADGLGIDVVATVIQRREQAHGTRLFGEGKLAEIAQLVAPRDVDPEDVTEGPPPPDLVLVDTELSPGQQRVIERAVEVEVLDRTALILRIFDRRAGTRIARNEVEIARLLYEAPRVRDDVAIGGRTGGGGGRGERGHTNAELARERIRARITALRRDIEAARAAEDNARARRSDTPVVALVGYTNAGKSSLLRGLTGSEVFIEDKLFATLDTTVRALQPETDPRVLVTDTVGFIENLPHVLVASFRSTLDAAHDADLRLFVVDAADPHHARQLACTREVIAELGDAEAAGWVVFNKVDRLDADERAALQTDWPDALLLSAHDPADMQALRDRLVAHFRQSRGRVTLRVPYARGHLLGQIHAAARVLHTRHDDEGTVLDIEADPATLARLHRQLEAG